MAYYLVSFFNKQKCHSKLHVILSDIANKNVLIKNKFLFYKARILSKYLPNLLYALVFCLKERKKCKIGKTLSQ